MGSLGACPLGDDAHLQVEAREGEALRESEWRLKTVVGNAPLIVFALDAEGVFTHSDGRALESIGLRAGEVVGASFLERYRDMPLMADAARKSLAGERVIATLEAWGRTFEITFTPRRGPGGVRAGVLGVAHDITESRRAEEEMERRVDARVADLITLNEALVREIEERDATERALQASEERYRSLVDASSQVVWVADMMGRMNMGETSWTDFTGQTPDESAGDGWVNALHPDDRLRTLLAWREAVATEGRYETDYRLRSRDGAYRHFVTRGVPVRDSQGNVREWIGACTDVTERRQAEEKYQSIFENAVEGIFQISVEGRYLSANPAMARITGFDNVEEMRAQVQDVAGQHFADAGANEEFGRALRERGAVSDFQARIRRKDGETAWISTSARVIRDTDGEVAFIEGSVVDITERKTADDRLALAYDATIEGWSRAMDLRDKETEGHSQRVTEMTLQLAALLGMGGEDLIHIRRGALLHDIGKMGVPDSILLKPGPLDEEEWRTMKLHPFYALEMLGPIEFLRPALDIPYAHHEKWDGSGYPLGLSGELIPESARIFAVADVWDALRSDRPYRKGWPEARVRTHIESLRGIHFDPRVVAAFLSIQMPG